MIGAGQDMFKTERQVAPRHAPRRNCKWRTAQHIVRLGTSKQGAAVLSGSVIELGDVRRGHVGEGGAAEQLLGERPFCFSGRIGLFGHGRHGRFFRFGGGAHHGGEPDDEFARFGHEARRDRQAPVVGDKIERSHLEPAFGRLTHAMREQR